MGSPHKSESTEARHRDGTIHSSDEIAVMAMERRGCVIQQEPNVNRKGGSFGASKVVWVASVRLDNRSRMNREIPVRF